MPVVSFEEEQQLTQKISEEQNQRLLGMSGWLVRKGVAANQSSANMILIAFLGVLVALSFFTYFVLGKTHDTDATDAQIRAAWPGAVPAGSASQHSI